MNAFKTFPLRDALRLGLLAGGVALLLSLNGMVQAFGEHDIIAGMISLGELLLLGVILVFSFAVVGRAKNSGWISRIAAGTLVGLTTELVLMVMVLIGEQVNLRSVFPNASPQLFGILRFGREGGTGFLMMIAAGAAGGGAGALLYLVPGRVRRPMIYGVVFVALLGLLEDLIGITLRPLPGATEATRWLFASGIDTGLTVLGAVVVFAVSAGAILVSGAGHVLKPPRGPGPGPATAFFSGPPPSCWPDCCSCPTCSDRT